MGQLWEDAPHDEWMDLGRLIIGVSPTSRAPHRQGPDPWTSRLLLVQHGVAIQRGLAWVKSRLDLDLYDEPDGFI